MAGVNILIQSERVAAMIQREQDRIHSVKLALITRPEVDVALLFPEYIPKAKTKDIDRAIAEGAPISVETTVSSIDARDFLSKLSTFGVLRGTLTGDDLDGMGTDF